MAPSCLGLPNCPFRLSSPSYRHFQCRPVLPPSSIGSHANLPAMVDRFLRAASPSTIPASSSKDKKEFEKEEVFFDGGPHYGDLLANLVFGFSLIWLPLTFAAVFRALFLRYRFTNLRVTILSGLTGGDRKDFRYDVITDAQFIPRFIGEWGDLVITLRDGTKVELKSVPKFREIAKYCLAKAGKEDAAAQLSTSGSPKKGFL